MNAEEKQNLKDVLKYILENVQTIYIIEKYKTKSFRVITLLVPYPFFEIICIDYWVGNLLSEFDFKRRGCKVKCSDSEYLGMLGQELYGDVNRFMGCYP